jgi:hypothetical protein
MDLNLFGRSSLQRGLLFNDDDLTANQLGILSNRQRRRFMLTSAAYPLAITLIVLICFGWFPVGEFWAQLTRPGISIIEAVLLWSVAILIGGVVVGLPIAGLHLCRNLIRDVRRDSVEQVTGVVSKSGELSLEWVQFSLQVGAQSFSLHYGGYRAFEHGVAYTVYYLPITRQVVSAEVS